MRMFLLKVAAGQYIFQEQLLQYTDGVINI